MKKFDYLIFTFITLLFAPTLYSHNHSWSISQDHVIFQDTSKLMVFSGKVVDKNSGDPVVFANVFITETRIGTVTNSDGEFIIKVSFSSSGKIGVAHIGYTTSLVSIEALKPEGNIIELTPAPYPIREVTIRNEDPAHGQPVHNNPGSGSLQQLDPHEKQQ